MDEAQVELICAGGVFEPNIIRLLSLLEERDFAVNTDGSEQGRYKTRYEVLH